MCITISDQSDHFFQSLKVTGHCDPSVSSHTDSRTGNCAAIRHFTKMDNQKTELAYKVEGATKKEKVINARREMRIDCNGVIEGQLVMGMLKLSPFESPGHARGAVEEANLLT